MSKFDTIGISFRDERIYEALLLSPQSSVRAIAEQTGINRGSVFESLKILERIGLITHITIGKRIHFSAKQPEVLHELVNERRRELSDLHGAIDGYISSLALERSDPSVFPFASFYDGDEGLAAILRDVLFTIRHEKLTEYQVISSPKVSEYLYNNFRHFDRERDKLNIQVRIVGLGAALRKELPSVERRVVHESAHDTGVYTLIYGNKVALATINKYNHTSGIVIENAGIAASQRMLFEALWQKLY